MKLAIILLLSAFVIIEGAHTFTGHKHCMTRAEYRELDRKDY